MMIKIADHTIISLIVVVQFLGSLFWLVSLPLLSYGGGLDHPYVLPLWIIFWSAGIVTAVLLQKKANTTFAWSAPDFVEPWRRLPALIWNSLLVGYLMLHGDMHWQTLSGSFVGYLEIYGLFVVAYLAITSGIGFAAGLQSHDR